MSQSPPIQLVRVLGVVDTTGAGSGTSSEFADPFPAIGTAVGFKDSTGTVMSPGSLDAAGNIRVSSGPSALATAALTNITASAVSQTALSANASRQGVSYVNDADVNCYLKYGTTASVSSFTWKLFPGEKWEPRDNYVGRVDVIWEAGPTGALRVTEMSA